MAAAERLSAGPHGAAQGRAAFLDRDGVINVDHGYVVRREEFEFLPGVLEGAARLSALGFRLVIVTNQSGIARKMYKPADFEALMGWVRGEFARAGAPIAGVYYCPHHLEEGVDEYRVACNCRKPAPGMLLDAARDLGIDLAASVMFGDRLDDMRAARAAGVPMRVWVGKDAKAVPAGEAEDGLVSARYRSLGEAIGDGEFLRKLSQVQAPSPPAPLPRAARERGDA
jgi:D-glycero-D-manno-heptose 1,7-bisphosphate phosphatase